MIRYLVRRALGRSLLLNINPQSVLKFSGSNQPLSVNIRRKIDSIQTAFPSQAPVCGFIKTCLWSLEPFRLRDSVFSQSIDIENEARYVLMQDFIHNRKDVTTTAWYRMLSEALGSTGFAMHKTIKLNNDTEIRAFLHSYVGGLVNSLEKTGYDASKVSDVGTAFIDADGAIQKCDAGNHRFSAARILGVATVPVDILGVHRDWYRAKVGRGGIDALRSALAEVEANHQSTGYPVDLPLERSFAVM